MHTDAVGCRPASVIEDIMYPLYSMVQPAGHSVLAGIRICKGRPSASHITQGGLFECKPVLVNGFLPAKTSNSVP